MYENRRHFRLKEYLDISWKVDNQEASGQGSVLNLSMSGMMVQIDKVFKPVDNCMMFFEFGADQGLPFTQKLGKVMWFRRIHTPQERFQCGIQFKDRGLDQHFERWMDAKITQLSEASDIKILSNLAT